VLRELRAGLFSMPVDPDRRGAAGLDTRTAMLLAPDILHVVGHTEAHHAIGADELISSCPGASGLDDALLGLPDPSPTDGWGAAGPS